MFMWFCLLEFRYSTIQRSHFRTNRIKSMCGLTHLPLHPLGKKKITISDADVTVNFRASDTDGRGVIRTRSSQPSSFQNCHHYSTVLSGAIFVAS